jgi:hypothetical protein
MQCTLKLEYFERLFICIFTVITYYIDIYRGNTNIILLFNANLILCAIWDKPIEKINRHFICFIAALSIFKLNFAFFLIAVFLPHLKKENKTILFKYVIEFGLISLILSGWYFLWQFDQLKYVLTYSDLHWGLKINAFLEFAQLSWIFSGFLYLILKLEKTAQKRYIYIIHLIIFVIGLKAIGSYFWVNSQTGWDH